MDTKGIMKELGAYTYEWNGEQNKIQLVEMEQADGWQVHKYRILVNGVKVVWNLEYIDCKGNISNDCDDKYKMFELFGKMVEIWEGTETHPSPEWIEKDHKYLFVMEKSAKKWKNRIETEIKEGKNYLSSRTRTIRPIVMPCVVAIGRHGLCVEKGGQNG